MQAEMTDCDRAAYRERYSNATLLLNFRALQL